MIENYLYQYLVTFAQTGSLKETSHQLHVTPASVSRGLKKLEKQLGVPLFIHQPHKLVLTDIGKFTVREVEKILHQEEKLPTVIKNYYQKFQMLTVGASTPAIVQLLQDLNLKDVRISNNMLSTARVKENLKTHHYSLIISSNSIETKDITSEYLGKEKLSVMLTSYNSLYSQASVSFADLSGNEFIVLKHLGEWKNLIENNIPNIQLIYQQNLDSYNELVEYSDFPLFKSSLALDDPHFIKNTKRKIIPVSSTLAQLPLFASFLKNDRQLVTPIYQKLKKSIKKADEVYSSTLEKNI